MKPAATSRKPKATADHAAASLTVALQALAAHAGRGHRRDLEDLRQYLRGLRPAGAAGALARLWQGWRDSGGQLPLSVPLRRDVQPLLKAWLAGLAPRSRAAYQGDLAAFAKWMNAPSAAVAVRRLLASGPIGAGRLASTWQGALRGTLAAGTVNRRLSCLGSVVKRANAEGLILWLLRVRQLPAVRYRDTAGPGREAVRKMMESAAGQGGSRGARDLGLLSLLFGRGLRRQEVAALNLADLDLKHGLLKVSEKGKAAPDSLPLAPAVTGALAAWVCWRGKEPGPLFYTASRRCSASQRLTAAGIYYLVGTLGQAAGMTVRPHGLRHTAITAAIEAGYSLLDVQKFSRHKDLRTLQTYYDRTAGVAADIGSALMSGLQRQ